MNPIEKAYIAQYYETMNDKAIGAALDIPAYLIGRYRRRNGLLKYYVASRKDKRKNNGQHLKKRRKPISKAKLRALLKPQFTNRDLPPDLRSGFSIVTPDGRRIGKFSIVEHAVEYFDTTTGQ